MNTVQIKKERLCVVNIHSIIDLITNSSTELFCIVEGSDKEVIQDLLNEMIEQFGCTTCKLSVEPNFRLDDETGEESVIPGQFGIWYEYYQEPCKLIKNKIKELLTIVEEPSTN